MGEGNKTPKNGNWYLSISLDKGYASKLKIYHMHAGSGMEHNTTQQDNIFICTDCGAAKDFTHIHAHIAND